ncbi:hypothetical protein KY284_019305 [Solanum tuberosum]|nr:hypothetical protein KY284_019305 [Solanum tuberosum]
MRQNELMKHQRYKEKKKAYLGVKPKPPDVYSLCCRRLQLPATRCCCRRSALLLLLLNEVERPAASFGDGWLDLQRRSGIGGGDRRSGVGRG